MVLACYLLPVCTYAQTKQEKKKIDVITVADWKKKDQKTKEQEVLLYFAGYWFGLQESISIFVTEEDQDQAFAIFNLISLNNPVTAKQFIIKVNDLIADEKAKDTDNAMPFIYKANRYFLVQAFEKLKKPLENNPTKEPMPNGPKITL